MYLCDLGAPEACLKQANSDRRPHKVQREVREDLDGRERNFWDKLVGAYRRGEAGVVGSWLSLMLALLIPQGTRYGQWSYHPVCWCG